MDAGLEVINDDGILQINGNFRNYLLERKLTLTGALYTNYPRFGYFYEFTAPSGSMIACHPVEGTFVTLHSTTVNGDLTTYTFMTPAGGALVTSPTCTFYVFSLLITPPNSTYGLEVYDAQSKLVFSSEASYMTPVTTWTGQDYTTVAKNTMVGNGGYAYSGAVLSTQYSRNNHAVVFGGPSGYWVVSSVNNDPGGGGGGTWFFDEDIYACFMGWRGGQLIMADDLIGGRSGQGRLNNSYGYTQYYLMLVDITKLLSV